MYHVCLVIKKHALIQYYMCISWFMCVLRSFSAAIKCTWPWIIPYRQITGCVIMVASMITTLFSMVNLGCSKMILHSRQSLSMTTFLLSACLPKTQTHDQPVVRCFHELSWKGKLDISYLFGVFKKRFLVQAFFRLDYCETNRRLFSSIARRFITQCQFNVSVFAIVNRILFYEVILLRDPEVALPCCFSRAKPPHFLHTHSVA